MKWLLLPLFANALAFSAWSMPVDRLPISEDQAATVADDEDVDEFDPSAPGAHETLEAFDRAYRGQTGVDTMSDFLNPLAALTKKIGGCYRTECHIFANVVRSERPFEMLYLYIDGVFNTSWKVSTAKPGHSTPDFDGNPSGPFYPAEHTSSKYPGGDYMGLGNMPYASFYDEDGGYAIHGTAAIRKLGHPASHGCVRSPPEQAHYFSQLVRATRKAQIWITVSQDPVTAH